MSDKWPGIERETTPGTPALPSVPKLWEKEVVKALTTPQWLRDYYASLPPPPPPTFKQRVRSVWWRVRNWWPLEWKDRSEDEWD